MSTSPETKSSTNNGWQPFTPDTGFGRPSSQDTVKLYRSGTIRISRDIAEKLGEPDKVQLLTNGSLNAFAVRAAETPMGAVSLTRGHHQREFKAGRLLASLGRKVKQITWPYALPHQWDGDVLVIDISEVPIAARPAGPAEGGEVDS